MQTHRCEIWWARLDQLLPAHLAILTPVELERREKLHRPADRERSALGAALLRIAAGETLGISPQDVQVQRHCPTCASESHGRPSIRELHVSVTHSGQWAGVAVTTAGPVGLDVEEASERLEFAPMLRMVLSPSEPPPPDRDGFFVYWTRKEAILKATGDGLRESMTKLTVSAPGESPRLIDAAGRPDLVELTQLHDLTPGAGYPAAAAVLSPLPLLVTQRFLTAE